MQTSDQGATAPTSPAPRCATCKHWDPYGTANAINSEYRLCLARKLDSSDPDGAVVAGRSSRYAEFVATGPQFGCVHHKAVESPHAHDWRYSDPDGSVWPDADAICRLCGTRKGDAA